MHNLGTAVSGFLIIGMLAFTASPAPLRTNAVPDVAPTIAFEVVSVKPTKTASDRETIESPPDSDGITIQNLTLQGIIEFAYNFHRSGLISGLPQWAKTQRYDLMAKVADQNVAAFHQLDQAQRRLMLQVLLAAKFQLKLHREQKEVPMYALVISKNGLKMKEATPGDGYPNGMRLQDGKPAGSGALMGPTGQGVQVSALVLMLSRLGLDREVMDKTGLTGKYDFSLRFAPEAGSIPVINGQPAAVSAEDAAQPSIFTALQEQLGLKLEPTKGFVEALVIDHIELPTED
jgi:uncharacterized protein (TIGR03435 family)